MGARASVTAINSGIQDLKNSTNQNLQKAVKAVEEGAGKLTNPREYVSKFDALIWAGCFLFGILVCFFIVQNYTVKMVRDNFEKQIIQKAEEPRKEAEAQAKKILEQARKDAKAIIQEAENRSGE